MTTQASPSERITSAWPGRLALASWLVAIPLLLFGGTVTSLDAGMAIDGWWVLEPGRGDHFLLFYPLEKWFRDIGTFSEHTHRLAGVMVGNLAIVAVIATFLKTRNKRARRVSMIALLSVCIQGVIGGTRVLENSPELAFLHGALAQIVFAILAYCAVILSRRYQRSEVDSSPAARNLTRLAGITMVLIYAAIFAGTWLRHAYSTAALVVHVSLVTIGVLAAFAVIGKLKRHALENPGKEPLRRAVRMLHILIGLQLLLGVASFWIVVMVAPEGPLQVHHSAYPTLHVLFGALVLAQLVAATVWSGRSYESESTSPASAT